VRDAPENPAVLVLCPGIWAIRIPNAEAPTRSLAINAPTTEGCLNCLAILPPTLAARRKIKKSIKSRSTDMGRSLAKTPFARIVVHVANDVLFYSDSPRATLHDDSSLAVMIAWAISCTGLPNAILCA